MRLSFHQNMAASHTSFKKQNFKYYDYPMIWPTCLEQNFFEDLNVGNGSNLKTTVTISTL